MESFKHILGLVKFDLKKIYKSKVIIALPIVVILLLAIILLLTPTFGPKNDTDLTFADLGANFGLIASYATFIAITVLSLMCINSIFAGDMTGINGVLLYTLPIKRVNILVAKFVASILSIICVSIVFVGVTMIAGTAVFDWDGTIDVSYMFDNGSNRLFNVNFYTKMLLNMAISIFGCLLLLSFFVFITLWSKSNNVAFVVTFVLFIFMSLIPIEGFFASFELIDGERVMQIKPAFYVVRFFPFMHIDLTKFFGVVRVGGALKPLFSFLANLIYTTIFFVLCFVFNHKKEIK